jgi:poly(3-hydroxybutyrate) depolymerase
MKKTLLLLPIVAVLAACGTTDPYGKRADQERDRQERIVERTIDKAPRWMTEIPISNSAVYASGTSASGDYSMALMKAKADAYGKICMTAGGTASQRTKVYKADTATTSSELSEMVLKTSCDKVDLTGVEVPKDGIKIVSEGTRYRAYVLIALPTGDANILKKAKEQAKLNELTARRAPEAFREVE